MCGIVGYTGFNDATFLSRMNDLLIHRGPDDGGTYSNKGNDVHLGMRRLSIIDLEGGKQPMSNPQKTLWIVFNGEIFNAPELRKECEKQGYAFRTDHSDTEVLIALYEQRGENMLEALNGMFAFVIFDERRNVLFGARDHFGIKPLFYSIIDGKFAFASELKALLKLPWITREIDHQAVSDYFTFQTIPAPSTIFTSCRKIPAAHTFTWNITKKSLSVRRFWQLPFHEEPQESSPETIRAAFEDAVQRWSQSDVPIACSLSGGIDSAAVTATLAKGRQRVQTFTVGFSDIPDLDERKEARRVADMYGTEHHEIELHERDFLADLDQMIEHLDEPYAGGLPTWFVFREMAKDVKVAMTGTGGDELFGNYGKWLVFESLAKRLQRLRTFWRNGGQWLDALRFPHGSLYYPYFTDGFKSSTLFTRDFSRGLRSSAALLEAYWKESACPEPRNAVAAVDLRLQLPEEFLFMTDRFSMAHSLEARTPFLDRTFAEMIIRIPPERRTRTDELKQLFIESIRDLLPPETLKDRKRGFVLPTGRWLRDKLRPLVEELCSRDSLEKQNIFLPDVFDTLVLPSLEGKAEGSWKLWTLLCFQLWYFRQQG